jgi:hypothetical protein
MKCLCGTALSPAQRVAGNKYCSQSCAAKFNNIRRYDEGWRMPLRARRVISRKLQGRIIKKPVTLTCKCCGDWFTYKGVPSRARKYCSLQCSYDARRLRSSERTQYYMASSFKFNVWNYPNEFELALIKKYGWYSASNRGGNLKGVSRDHLFSIADGRRLGVPPKLLAHPANCRLLRHPDNKAKAHASAISLKVLRKRIVAWNLKYLNRNAKGRAPRLSSGS